MSDDAQLLREFAREGSEAAFRQLVERHIQLVNSTARRILAGDAHLAQDVTQLVFTDLARKAAELPAGVLLGGWLYRHTCYTAMKAIRTENRRRARERTAMEINALNDSSAGDAHWLQLAPVLDDALNQLDAEDRDAIVLRYLQQLDVRSVGLALGASENAAQKRLGRALEKLRGILTRRGITVSAILLGTALDAGAATAPTSAGLAASVSASALSGAAKATHLAFLISNLKTMTTSKIVIGLTAIVVAAGIATVLLNQNSSTPAAPAAKAAVAAPKAPVLQTAAAKIEAPKVAPAVPHNVATAATDTAAPEADGALTWTGDPSVTNTFTVGGGGGMGGSGTLSFSPGGNVTVSSGTVRFANPVTPSGGNAQMMIMSSPNDPAQVNGGTVVISQIQQPWTPTGDPTSTTVNADGSTTNTYTQPNGATTEVTVSADGRSRTMKSMPPSSSSN